MSNALKFFQQSVLELDTLTNDQKEKLDKIRILRRVLINGRAGSGKTFVAMNRILKLLALRRNVQLSEVIILVCSDYLSLGNDLVKWLRVRLGGSINEVNLQLKKIHFLFRSGMCELRICKIGNEEEVVSSPVSDEKRKYELIVVDEGHHVFAKKKLSKRLPLLNEVKEIVKDIADPIKLVFEFVIRLIIGLAFGLQLAKITMTRWRVTLLVQFMLQLVLVPLINKGLITIVYCLVDQVWPMIGLLIILFVNFSMMIVEAIMALLSQLGSSNLCMILLQESLVIVFMQYLLFQSGITFDVIANEGGMSKYSTKVLDKMKELKGVLKICLVSLLLHPSL